MLYLYVCIVEYNVSSSNPMGTIPTNRLNICDTALLYITKLICTPLILCKNSS